MSDAKDKEKPEPGSRDGKTMIGAYVSKDALYTLQEHLLKLTRKRGKKVTMQEFIIEALRTQCAKDNIKIDL
jgi:hypothetical protein